MSAATQPARRALAALSFALPLALPAAAAAQAAADRTGTGGGPASTITAPYTNHLGVTKPPGGGPGRDARPASRAEERERAASQRIERSICAGCD